MNTNGRLDEAYFLKFPEGFFQIEETSIHLIINKSELILNNLQSISVSEKNNALTIQGSEKQIFFREEDNFYIVEVKFLQRDGKWSAPSDLIEFPKKMGG